MGDIAAPPPGPGSTGAPAGAPDRRDVADPSGRGERRPDDDARDRPARSPTPAPDEAAVGGAASETSTQDVPGPGSAGSNGGGDDSERARCDEQLRRALADLDNLRKRFDREVTREREAERARVAAQWLPVVDDLERAIEHADTDPSAVIAGVRVVRDHAVAVLERLGFQPFGGVGERFDPARHEALGTVEADALPGTVVAVARPGYGKDGAVLRPAGVLVARDSH